MDWAVGSASACCERAEKDLERKREGAVKRERVEDWERWRLAAAGDGIGEEVGRRKDDEEEEKERSHSLRSCRDRDRD